VGVSTPFDPEVALAVQEMQHAERVFDQADPQDHNGLEAALLRYEAARRALGAAIMRARARVEVAGRA
jgi:hypothetical protein